MNEKQKRVEEFLKSFRDSVFVNLDEQKEHIPRHSINLQEVLSLNESGRWSACFSVNGFADYIRNPHRKSELVTSLNAHFVDIDNSNKSLEEIKSEMTRLAADKGIPFTYLVETGRGFHGYWVFKEPVMNPTDDQKNTYKSIQASLIKIFSADEQARDIARLLRVPLSRYWKDESGKEIQLDTITEHRYDESDFIKFVGLQNNLQQKRNSNVIDMLKHGVPIGEGKRHGALAQIAGILLKGARTQEQVSIARQNLYDWDQRMVGSPETWSTRKTEVDAVFESILKRELGNRSTESKTFAVKIELLNWGEINALAFPPNRWLINGVIPKAGVVILAAISGEGKTWVALEMARAIATGAPLFGQEKFNVKKGRVLYIDAENGRKEIQRRGRQLGFKEDDDIAFFVADDINLNDDAWCEELKQKISSEGIDVVIVDTFRGVAGKIQEEKAEEIRAFFNRYKGLREKEVCIIWLDHFRKPDHFAGKVPKKEHLFGSQDKTGNSDILLMMKKEENDITIYQRKNRLGEEIKEFKILMKDEDLADGSRRTTLIYEGEVDEEESKKEIAKEYIRLILVDNPKTTSEIKRMLQNDKEIAQRNVREALKDLLIEKVIRRRKKGREDEYYLPNVADEPTPLPELY
jgi:predicted ATP-dependent serine protease